MALEAVTPPPAFDRWKHLQEQDRDRFRREDDRDASNLDCSEIFGAKGVSLSLTFLSILS